MKLILFLIIFFLFSVVCVAQQPFRVMWYNVENLFDTYDDPATRDDEFTPSGNRYWSPKRYYHKLQQLAKVIVSAGEWDTPALVGLCEVENDSVLIHLLNRTPLRQQQYRYCIADTQDERGIRTALLYQRDKFRYLGESSIDLTAGGSGRRTRDLLHVWGEVITGDTLDVLLAHFPSRYGGERESEGRRLYAANRTRAVIDSLVSVRSSPYILLMGDLNDEPNNKSVKHVLVGNDLYNMKPFSANQAVTGTHKYQGQWSQLDHLIVNGLFLEPSSPFQLQEGSARILTNPFLLTPDKTHGGVRPKRTYYGFRYEGGYSDHLPLVADFLLSLSER
ncbi:MAG: endonuclease [Tannerellaceae bacterium]|nr:endonuclease [Tannerellaceae bacterium]